MEVFVTFDQELDSNERNIQTDNFENLTQLKLRTEYFTCTLGCLFGTQDYFIFQFARQIHKIVKFYICKMLFMQVNNFPQALTNTDVGEC